MVPDSIRDGELRSIVWDDEAGTVSGDHFEVQWIQSMLSRRWPRTVSFPPVVRLEDPAHDPRDFWWLLHVVYWPMMEPPLDVGLPRILREVEPREIVPNVLPPGYLS